MNTAQAVETKPADGFEVKNENRDTRSLEKLLETVRQISPRKFREIGKRHNYHITKDSYFTLENEAMRVIQEKLGIPETPPMEESDDFKKLVQNRPKNATSLVVAQYTEDKGSAIAGKYFFIVPVRTVALAWNKRERDSFEMLRQIAATFEETKHLGMDAAKEVEHREHMQKRGIYLKNGAYEEDGWVVRSISLKEMMKYKNMEDHLVSYDEPKEEDAPSHKKAAQSVVIKENDKKNSIEIAFSSKPSTAVINALLRNGWSSNKARRLWYMLSSDKAKAFATALQKKVNEK